MRLGVAVFVAVLVSLLPGGEAQTEDGIQFSWRVPEDDTPLPPGEPTERVVVLEIRCAPGTPPPGDPLSFTVQLAFQEGAAHEAVYEESVQVSVPPSACAASQIVERPVPVILTLSLEAPGLKPVHMNLTAVDAAGASVTQSWSVTPELVAGLEAWVEEPYAKAKPDARVPMKIHVQNNGNTNLKIQVRPAPERSEALGMALPDAYVLRGGPPNVLPIMVITPAEFGGNDRTDALVLSVVWTAIDDPEMKGSSADLTFTVETKGVYLDAPGPAMVWTTVLLVGVIAATRRLRG